VAPDAAAVARARLATTHLEAVADGSGASAGGSPGRRASQRGTGLNTCSSGRPRGLGGPGRADRLAGLRSFDSGTSGYDFVHGANLIGS
jgi:hypothetical protein